LTETEVRPERIRQAAYRLRRPPSWFTHCKWRQRSYDPDRLLALPHAIAELQPRPEARDEGRVRTGEGDEQLVVERQPRQTAPGPDADPPLPALAGQQLPGGLLEPFAVTLATLLTLAV
jgi:hypothetical protein